MKSQKRAIPAAGFPSIASNQDTTLVRIALFIKITTFDMITARDVALDDIYTSASMEIDAIGIGHLSKPHAKCLENMPRRSLVTTDNIVMAVMDDSRTLPAAQIFTCLKLVRTITSHLSHAPGGHGKCGHQTGQEEQGYAPETGGHQHFTSQTHCPIWSQVLLGGQ